MPSIEPSAAASSLAATASGPADLSLHEGAPGIGLTFRLPLRDFPAAQFRSSFGYENARVVVSGLRIATARTRPELEAGVSGTLPSGEILTAKLNGETLAITVNGKRALREDQIFAKPTRSAWIHAVIALLASAAGFTASAFYLVKSSALSTLDPMSAAWAYKMGIHTAGWHLLLTFVLFPASVWGQRIGIRAVQVTALVFFCIHVGIALANADMADPAIAFFNAVSGLLFAASVVYGNRAHRDMDPLLALRTGRL